jgi:hypothetical protein
LSHPDPLAGPPTALNTSLSQYLFLPGKYYITVARVGQGEAASGGYR